MNINKKLNLVIPIESDDGTKIYVHSTPISNEAFEENFVILAKTLAAITGEGLGIIAGPRVAYLMLKKLAEQTGDWETVQSSLVNEIRRRTNVIIPARGDWQTIPYEEALSKKYISDEDASEVDNAVTFFIVNSAMHKREMREAILPGAATLWGGELTSLNSTEFANSLRTSTEAENTGEKAIPLSIPA